MGRAALHALSRLGHHVAPAAQHEGEASGKLEGGSATAASAGMDVPVVRGINME